MRHEMLREEGNRFRVSIGFMSYAMFREEFTQFAEVLDDAVVDNGDFARTVGVRVAFGGCAVRGPTGVTNTCLTSERFMYQTVGQVYQFAYRPTTIQNAVIHGRNTRRVIAAVFKPFQRFHQNWRGFVIAENSYNPTHN